MVIITSEYLEEAEQNIDQQDRPKQEKTMPIKEAPPIPEVMVYTNYDENTHPNEHQTIEQTSEDKDPKPHEDIDLQSDIDKNIQGFLTEREKPSERPNSNYQVQSYHNRRLVHNKVNQRRILRSRQHMKRNQQLNQPEAAQKKGL